MNGREFLETARHLAVCRNESDWRSAVSRAYYAVFHATRDLLASLRFRTPRADRAHNYIYVRLNNCGHPAVEQSANSIHGLRTSRNQADYDTNHAMPADAAADAIADAESILQTLDHLTAAEQQQITTAIRTYEQQIGDVTWQP